MEACTFANEAFPFGCHFPLRDYTLGQKVSNHSIASVIEDEPAFFSSYAVITNLRHPKARLQSGFFHIFHDCKRLQIELNVTGKGRPTNEDAAFVKSIIANDTKLQTTLRKYVDCVKGCSVKMIAGYSCGADISDSSAIVPKQVVDKALSRIEKFAYVGFQEHWADSVKMFLGKFGGDFSEETLENNRKRHSAFTEEEVNKVAALLDQPEYHDEYDHVLYQHAFAFHWKQNATRSEILATQGNATRWKAGDGESIAGHGSQTNSSRAQKTSSKHLRSHLKKNRYM